MLTWIALTALLCAIAVVLTLVLNAPARARLLALLKTLGAPPRSGAGIVSWELVPLCVAAIVAGTAPAARTSASTRRAVMAKPVDVSRTDTHGRLSAKGVAPMA